MSGAIVKSIQLRREKAKKEKESQPKKIGQEEGFVPEISVLEADRAAAALASVYSQQDHQPKKKLLSFIIMEDPIKLLRQSLKANAVLEQRQKLLQAEIVDLQLALVERAQPGAVSELAAQVARLKAENATLICKYKRSKLAAKEAVAGLREALTTERALRKEAQAKLIHFQRHHRDFSDGGESSSGIAEQQQSSSVDDDERYLWQFPTNINFPLTPASSKGKEKEIAGVTTALRHDIESRDHNDRHYPPEDYQEDSQEILDEDDIHLLPPRIHSHHENQENDNTTFISTNTMRRRQQPQSSVDNNTIEKEEM